MSEEENEEEQKPHRADVQQLLVSKEEVPPEQQEWSPSLNQEDPPELPHIKEEQEELWTSQEGEQLRGLEEADIIKFTFTPVLVKSEEEKPQSLQLHQRQTKEIKTEADREDCGGSEPARNFNPDSHLQSATHDETSHSSEPETDDRCDWYEEPQSALNNEVLASDKECNTGKTSVSSYECATGFSHKGHLQKHNGIQIAAKSFCCSICGKRYHLKNSKITHIRCHSEGKRFSCSFCRPIAEYEEELCHQHKLLDAVFNPEVRLHRADVQQLFWCEKEVTPEQQEWSPSLDQEDPPEMPHIKEEQEELWTSQEGKQLRRLEEADITKFTFTPVPVKSEEDEEKPQSSQLHQRQTEGNRDAEHMKAEADGEHCGSSEPVRNFNPDSHLQPDTHDKTSHSSETDDSCDWEETRETQSELYNNGKTSVSSSECTAIFGHEGHLQKHNGIQTGVKPFSCSVCGNRFGDSRTLRRHMIVHTGEKLFNCSVCGKRFTQRGTLNRHLAGHTGEKPFSCSVCGKKFAQHGTLKQHLTVHTGEKQFSCSVCDERFTRKDHLRQHLTVHTGEKLFSCSVCGKRFGGRGHLKQHLSVHTGEKPFSCSVCDGRFARKSHLRRHLSVHTGEKPFSCSVCDKRFAQKGELREHSSVHTDDKPFRCSVCSKGFGDRRNLRRHMRIHTGDKPFSCSFCGKGFGERGYLRRHMRVHTDDKPFSCSVCGKGFVERGYLRRHMKIHTAYTQYLKIHSKTTSDTSLLLSKNKRVMVRAEEVNKTAEMLVEPIYSS